MKISVLMPVYNVESTIADTLSSILSQSFRNFEVIIQDNHSTDHTYEQIKTFKSNKIKYFRNRKNLGYSMNLVNGKKNCSGDIIFLLAGDDIVSKDALFKVNRVFKKDARIGAVTRPYYWFEKNIDLPVRVKKQLNPNRDELVRITDSKEKVFTVLSTIDQLSGLSFRTKYMTGDFDSDPWISHGYPFLDIFKNHPIVFLKDYIIAVRIAQNTSRTNIYQKSPMKSWINMCEKVLHEDKFEKLKQSCITDFIAINYVGLLQIRSFGSYKAFLREVLYLIKYRWINVFHPVFLAFFFVTLITPRFALIKLTDWYKNNINPFFITRKIHFKY